MAHQEAPASPSDPTVLFQNLPPPPRCLRGMPVLTVRSPAQMTPAEIEGVLAYIDAFPRKVESLRQTYESIITEFPLALPFSWEECNAYCATVYVELCRKIRDVCPAPAPNQADGAPKEMEVDAKKDKASSSHVGDAPTKELNEKASMLKEVKGELCAGESRERRLALACEGMRYYLLVEMLGDADGGIQRELLPALRRAPSAPCLVLNATTYLLDNPPGDDIVWENFAAVLRCVPALTETIEVIAIVGAASLARKWKQKIDRWSGAGSLRGGGAKWALLHFLAAYGVGDALEDQVIMGLFDAVRDRKGSAALLKSVWLHNKAAVFIDHLMKNEQYIDAVKVVRAFNWTHKYPPVALLKRYIENVKEAALQILSQNAIKLHALNREMEKKIAALKSAHDAISYQDVDFGYKCTIMTEVFKLKQLHDEKKMSLTTAARNQRSKNKNNRQTSAADASASAPAPPTAYHPYSYHRRDPSSYPK